MKFKSVNEIEHFNFKDAVIHSFQVDSELETISLELEAVIVTPENSQNSNYTFSYAGDLVMRFTGARLQVAVKEGYKYYDANDVLVEEVPDTKLSVLELDGLLGRLEGTYMWNMTKVDDEQNDTGHFLYLMGIDLGDEDDTTYWMQLEFDQVIMEWDKYMNRVEMG